MVNNTRNYSGAANHIKWGTTFPFRNIFHNVDWSLNNFWFTVKKYPDTDATDALAIIQKTEVDMTIEYNVDDPLNPFTSVVLILQRPDTEQTPGIYQYDFKTEDVDGEVILLSGCFEIRSVVTGGTV